MGITAWMNKMVHEYAVMNHLTSRRLEADLGEAREPPDAPVYRLHVGACMFT